MAYLPPPPPPVPRGRRPPRWSPPDFTGMVEQYADGDLAVGRRVRRHLAPMLTRLAEAGLGRRSGRQAIAHTAVSVALAGLEDGTLGADPVTTAFRAVAHVVEATGHDLPALPVLTPSDRAVVRLVEVELADADRVARTLSVPSEAVAAARAAVAGRLGVSVVPDSECPGWQVVRRGLRDPGTGAVDHRRRCGRCGMAAELLGSRRQRLWPGAPPPGGPFAAVFDPPH